MTSRDKILLALLKAKASEEGIVAKLWATDPEAFGTDDDGVIHQKGKAEGFEQAARLFEEFANAD